jgi:hypothetical protein
MNVYVVTIGWLHDGATVIGAAVDRVSAERIADARDDALWNGWDEEVVPEGSCTWVRTGRFPDGTPHPRLFQEIVVVPLAGYAERDQVSAGRPPWARHADAEIQEIGRLFGAP